jgi:hypothetical protein
MFVSGYLSQLPLQWLIVRAARLSLPRAGEIPTTLYLFEFYRLGAVHSHAHGFSWILSDSGRKSFMDIFEANILDVIYLHYRFYYLEWERCPHPTHTHTHTRQISACLH